MGLLRLLERRNIFTKHRGCSQDENILREFNKASLGIEQITVYI